MRAFIVIGLLFIVAGAFGTPPGATAEEEPAAGGCTPPALEGPRPGPFPYPDDEMHRRGLGPPGGTETPRGRFLKERWRRRMEEMEALKRAGAGPAPLLAVPFIPIVLFLVVGAVVVAAIVSDYYTKRRRYELVQWALKEGKTLPAEFAPECTRDRFAAGLVLAATGVGLAVALGVAAAPRLAAWGAVPFLIGLALLAASAWGRRKTS